MKICYVVGAAKVDSFAINKQEDDFIIAADGGMDNLRKNNLTADLWLGDMDSTKETGYLAENKYKCEKDETDMFLALNEGLKRGYKTFVIYGALGGRLDHTLANMQHLVYLAKNGAKGFLVDEDNLVTAIYNSEMVISNARGMVSVFASEKFACGVTLSGLKYCVENITLNEDFPLGVSNEFTSEESQIKVENGVLWVVSESRNLKYFLK